MANDGMREAVDAAIAAVKAAGSKADSPVRQERLQSLTGWWQAE